MQNTLKIGHRGAKAYATENTLPSIEKALELGVDGIEIDVHKCASGELIVFHDFTLDRMTNGSGEVSKFSLSQLKSLFVNNHNRIPTLDEVLNLINKRCILNIEPKGSNTARSTMELINRFIENHGWNIDQFLISSFQQKELETAHQISPGVKLGVLTKASVSEAITFAKTINAYAIHPNIALLTKANVQKAQKEGFKVISWTVNEKSSIERMKSYKVDGIISDNPDLL